MPLENPLSGAEFADQLRVKDVQLTSVWHQQSSISGGADRLYADRAPSLWRAEVSIVPLRHAEAEGVMALINSRGGGLKTILLYPTRLPFPASDPRGEIIGATLPSINVISDRLHASFSGFPPGYVIPVGTWFSCVFDSSRYYLGQFAEHRIAGPAGAVVSVELTPPLPSSITSGTSITVAKPPGKFRIVPNSAMPLAADLNFSAIQFSAEQTYSR
ncbi:MAG: hypothetical protein KIT02_10285 [Devosia sp.]|uniref:hypothetical protein n=1 Tax=Devosia sp. TaxID=1871048 RepID=UPI0024C828EE|nr:hypothetical protein [Devosia sp.]UYN98354.1 MAG: hypothetical protein KIT02_10285 [Devosia sp.]